MLAVPPRHAAPPRPALQPAGPAPGAGEAAPAHRVNPLWMELATSTPGARARVQRVCAPCAAGGEPCSDCDEEERPQVQTKVRVGPANDRYEVEADHVADHVLRLAVPPAAARVSRAPITPLVRRQEDESGPEEDDEVSAIVQSRRAGGGTPDVSPGNQSYIAGLPGRGRPLPDETRAYLEPRFGLGFGGVRVHTDAAAQRSAGALRARAYTVGQDVVFGPGEYQPQSAQGMHLLAHELSHVVQQGGAQASDGAGAMIRRQPEPAEEADVETPIEEEDAPVFDVGDAALEAQEEGERIETLGVVQTEDGANLWPETGRTQPMLGTLPFNTLVFIDRRLDGTWFSVYVEKHQRGGALPVAPGTHGFVQAIRVSPDMPDPEAWLYRITKPGQGALALAAELYPNYAPDCELGVAACRDWRYLVNVLVAVNDAAGRRFLYKENAGDDWDRAKTMRATVQPPKKGSKAPPASKKYSGGQIWVPGMELVKALEGQVSSGSISLEALTTLKDILIGVAAFIVGLLDGAISSILDIFIGVYDLIVLAKDLIIKIFTGTIISDAKGLWDDLSKVSISDIIDLVGAKWNAPSTWDRWKFRGYVIGYAIVEILLLIFSVGAVTAIKWAGKAAKVGKFARYLAELPRVKKFLDAGKALSGKGMDAIRAAMKAGEVISEAHGWAAKALRLPLGILRRLSQADIEKLKRLPQWVRERFARLADEVKLRLLGCFSPCKVDPDRIVAELKLVAKTGAKLLTPDDVIKALKAAEPSLRVNKISVKLRKKGSALMEAIQRAGLTDADFGPLRHFVTEGDKINQAMAYKTFVRYLTNAVPAKVGPDIKKLNDVVAAMVRAEVRRGSALKGSMFEQWVAMHLPQFAGMGFKRITFDLKKLIKKAVPPYQRHVDKWVPDPATGTGQIWDMKHYVGRVPADQVDDYAKLVGKVAPDGNTVTSVNYLFPTKAAATANRHILSNAGFLVYYVDELTSTMTRLF